MAEMDAAKLVGAVQEVRHCLDGYGRSVGGDHRVVFDFRVTLCHSRTRDLPDVVRRADVVIAAVGQPRFVRGAWVKPGAAVIDVGVNRVEGKLVGDVAFDEVNGVAGLLTPVPGGVGLLTIAMLLRNTVRAFELQAAAGRA